MLLARMFNLVETGKIQDPIYQPDQAPVGTSNKAFLQEYVAKLLRGAFSNLQEAQITNFVIGLFALNNDFARFRVHLRDFLISLKEFAGDNAELFAEEREQEKAEMQAAERDRAMKVGGLLKPADMDGDDEL